MDAAKAKTQQLIDENAVSKCCPIFSFGYQFISLAELFGPSANLHTLF